MEFIIKPLSRYQGAVFPIFGGFWGYQMTDITVKRSLDLH